MPRIHPRHILRAKAIDHSLPRLLPVCRDLASARNELKWLKDHAITVSRQLGLSDHAAILNGLTQRRALGEPLQYILGSGYFGDLEIRCRPGVLIPRPETAASVSHLVGLIAESDANTNAPSPLRVLDLCTGSGCIPLLFHQQYYHGSQRTGPVQLVGIDVSSQALSLARENLMYRIATQSKKQDTIRHATTSLQGVGFVQADVLNGHKGESTDQDQGVISALNSLSSSNAFASFDILISNPPYISPKEFRTTPRSVRKYEPRLALVPAGEEDDTTADMFYPPLLQLAEQVDAKVALFEVSDLEQAQRVVRLAIQQKYWEGVEIWRDEPRNQFEGAEHVEVAGQKIKVRGSGHGRSVFCYRDEAAQWLHLDL